MPISQEELNQRPMSTRLFPMEDLGNINRFAVMLRFPSGRSQVWTLEGPSYPIDEEWMRAALTKLLEEMTRDLKVGNPLSNPPILPDRVAFGETNWASVTGAVRKLLEDWEKKRRNWTASNATPLQ